MIAGFTASHREHLERLSQQLYSMFATQAEIRENSDQIQIASAQQKILDSLHFQQIHERRDQIFEAHNNTYRWILESPPDGSRRWDDFPSWLRSSSPNHKIYWVTGKIGSGKSTMIRYIHDNLDMTWELLPWATTASMVRASFFFWSGGTILQKSTLGLLRTILTQLFQEAPNLISEVVPKRKWQVALLLNPHIIEWTISELQECLKASVLRLGLTKQVLLLVDGLDELEGTEEARETMVALLVDLSTNPNVKICLSSRPWNIFRDAFEDCAQLKLEDINHKDIEAYVREQLSGNKRFQTLLRYDTTNAEALMTTLMDKATGVFLWVYLVVRELLRGIRDGDGIVALEGKLNDIPADLNDYLMRVFESIEPHRRREASELFQIALHREDEFTSMHSFTLIDFSFIEEQRPDFALSPSYDFLALDYAHTGALAFRLESTVRRINSRCKGLLQCRTDGAYLNYPKGVDRQEALDKIDPVFVMAQRPVDFLHRSLRDFLMTREIQDRLQHYTKGSYDTRMFYRSARLVQLIALNRVAGDTDSMMGLASHVLSTLTVASYRDTPDALTFATIAKPVIEALARRDARELDEIGHWYLSRVLSTWQREQSTFLSLAIDFGLQSYVRTHLTPHSVQSKKGRPMLDYVLRPRFAILENSRRRICVGDRIPDLNNLDTVLNFGAHPNQIYQHASIWARFLCFMADYFRMNKPRGNFIEERTFLRALSTLIESGADVLIPRHWLIDTPCFDPKIARETTDGRLIRRFPNVILMPAYGTTGSDLFAVSDLLECFSYRLGSSLDNLRAKLLPMEARCLQAGRLTKSQY